MKVVTSREGKKIRPLGKPSGGGVSRVIYILASLTVVKGYRRAALRRPRTRDSYLTLLTLFFLPYVTNSDCLYFFDPFILFVHQQKTIVTIVPVFFFYLECMLDVIDRSFRNRLIRIIFIVKFIYTLERRNFKFPWYRGMKINPIGVTQLQKIASSNLSNYIFFRPDRQLKFILVSIWKKVTSW